MDRDKVRALLWRIKTDTSIPRYAFPASLSSGDRKFVHNLARKYKLISKSKGSGSNRFISVFKNEKATAKHDISNVPCTTMREDLVSECELFLLEFPLDQDKTLLPITDSLSSPYAHIKPFCSRGTHTLLSINKPGIPIPSFDVHLEQTMKLPMFNVKNNIIKAIKEWSVLIIESDTGSGKTTQIPQYILEDACDTQTPCRIICALPRRLAVLSVYDRVCKERGETNTVGYQIRSDKRVSGRTLLTFCTTGILLNTLIFDSNRFLKNVTHIILDEFHERNCLVDVTLLLLKAALVRYPHLKIIIMSATMNTGLLAEYLPDTPLKVFFVDCTSHQVDEDFLEDILLRFPNDHLVKYTGRVTPLRKDEKLAPHEIDAIDKYCSTLNIDYDLIIDLITASMADEPGAVLVFLPGYAEIIKLKSDIITMRSKLEQHGKFIIYCLHSKIKNLNQKAAFSTPPEGVRKIILATNVAEMSITIEDIVYIIDTGKAKQKNYEPFNGSMSLTCEWISQSNVIQRTGRAGRTASGKCFHLYTRQIMEFKMPPFPQAEIFCIPLEELCLNLKTFARSGVSVSEFFKIAIEPPPMGNVMSSIVNLKTLGALDPYENLTYLGQFLQMMPIHPRYGKMVLYGVFFKVLEPVLIIACTLAHGDPFCLPSDDNLKKAASDVLSYFSNQSFSDHLIYYMAYKEWSQFKDRASAMQWCYDHFINNNDMLEIQDMIDQIQAYLKTHGFIQQGFDYNANIANWGLVKAVLTAGLYPNIALIKDGKNIEAKRTPRVSVLATSALKLNATALDDKNDLPKSKFIIFDQLNNSKHVFNNIQICSLVSDVTVALFAGPTRTNKDAVTHLRVNQRPDRTEDSQFDIDTIFNVDNWLKIYTTSKIGSILLQLRQKLNYEIESFLKNPNRKISKEGTKLVALLGKIIHMEEEDALKPPFQQNLTFSVQTQDIDAICNAIERFHISDPVEVQGVRRQNYSVPDVKATGAIPKTHYSCPDQVQNRSAQNASVPDVKATGAIPKSHSSCPDQVQNRSAQNASVPGAKVFRRGRTSVAECIAQSVRNLQCASGSNTRTKNLAAETLEGNASDKSAIAQEGKQ